MTGYNARFLSSLADGNPFDDAAVRRWTRKRNDAEFEIQRLRTKIGKLERAAARRRMSYALPLQSTLIANMTAMVDRLAAVLVREQSTSWFHEMTEGLLTVDGDYLGHKTPGLFVWDWPYIYDTRSYGVRTPDIRAATVTALLRQRGFVVQGWDADRGFSTKIASLPKVSGDYLLTASP